MQIKIADSFWDSLKEMGSFQAKIIDFFYKIKWFFQRIFRPCHVSDIDLWNLDITLAEVIYPKLKMFRHRILSKGTHGYPLAFSSNDGGEVGGEFEGWVASIDEMLFAFEFILAQDGRDKKLVKKLNLQYGEWDMWDVTNKSWNKEIYIKMSDRARNGLKLFGEYFWNLWD